MRAFVMRRSYSLSSHECYEFSHKSSCFCTVRYWVFRFQTVCVIDKNVLDWYCYFNIKYLYLISTYLYCYLGYLYLNIAKKYLLRCNNKTFLCRVVNRYTEIRISIFGPDIRIWKYSYDNRKQSANSQGLRRLPGHSGESRQLIQWNMIRCLTVDRCSNRHQSAVQSPECSCSKRQRSPPTPLGPSSGSWQGSAASLTNFVPSMPPRPGLDRRERPCTLFAFPVHLVCSLPRHHSCCRSHTSNVTAVANKQINCTSGPM